MKESEVELELLSDIDMVLMIEQGIRGGISMIPNRHGSANNKFMGEKFKKEERSKFIVYLDANNLYGWAMCEALPFRNFKWMDSFEKWRDVPCILEVDLENA